MTLYILILQRLLLNRFLRLLMSWDMYGGPAQVWKLAGEQGELESKIEERIINRFAAELLMPAKQFRKTFWVHREKLGLDPSKLRLPDLIRVMVLQFVNAF